MEEHGSSLLTDAVPMLGFALASVLVFRRLGLGATLGFLVAGALVGPHVLGLVHDAEGKLGIAELGIALLLFLVGLELSPARLWRMRRDIFALGTLQVVACGAVLTGVVAIGTDISTQAVVALALPLALSSTAQVLPMLQSAGRLRTPLGEKAFAILLFQDLSLIPLITIISAMSRNPDSARPVQLTEWIAHLFGAPSLLVADAPVAARESPDSTDSPSALPVSPVVDGAAAAVVDCAASAAFSAASASWRAA